MKVGCSKSFGRWTSAATLCLFVTLLGSFGFHQQCRAQQSLSQTALSPDPLKQISWVSGPQKISLADCAYIDIPAGYRLTDAHGARVILQNANNPIPDNLIGLLATDSGKWWAVLQYNPNGYIKDPGARQIDAAAVLKAVQARNQNASITSINWESQPVYDAQKHSLAWSFKLHSASMQALNETVLLFGRRGDLQLTAFRPYPLADAPFLTKMVQNITFKDGERYADYQPGDQVADAGLEDLIVGGKAIKTASGGFTGATAAWIYSVIGVVILGGGILLMKKNRRHRSASRPVQASAPAAQAASVPAMSFKAPAAPVAAAAVAAKPVAAMGNGSNGNGAHATNGNGSANGKKHLHRSRRRKVFDYPKFYTNVMRELSRHSYGPGTAVNGKKSANGYANGHSSAATNGNGNGSANGHASGSNGNGVNETIRSEIVDLIATQKNLIQEQKCLLEQQTRLIEEKRWLIEEQTAFIKGQSVQQYPLKFE